MAYEIEHKYLVINTDYREMAKNSRSITQGYLSRNPECVVRVRIADDKAFLTVKGRNFSRSKKDAKQDIRHEFEYEIPADDARTMLGMTENNTIDKTRFIVPYQGFVWEVDEFHGSLEGLTVAEIELKSPDDKYALPPFVGEEVTGNPAYYNSNLIGKVL